MSRFSTNDKANNLLDPNKVMNFLSKKYDENNELTQIQQKIGHVENESLDSTRRTLRTLNESYEMGVKTNEMLNEQGEKLNRVKQTLDNVNEGLDSTQTNMRQLRSIFGAHRPKFFDKISNVNKRLKNQSQLELKDTFTKQNFQEADAVDRFGKTNSDLSSLGNMSKSSRSFETFNDGRNYEFAKITGSDREVEINRNLQEMSTGLDRLKDLGLTMRNELDKQNTDISSIEGKTEFVKQRVDDQTHKMNYLLK